MIEHLVSGERYAALPPVADDWHQHEFTPHVDRPQSCIVCGRVRVWRHHFGPFGGSLSFPSSEASCG